MTVATPCYYTTNSISIHASGNITQCCSSGQPIPNATLFGDTDNVINNPYMVSLRNDLNNGIKNESCKNCWNTENANGDSFRKHSIKFARAHDIIREPHPTIIHYDDIYLLDIFMGNKCNLACRMCWPGSSTLVARHVYKTDWGENAVLPDSLEIKINDSLTDKIFEIISKCKNLKYIHLYGGEPLLIEFHDDLCNYLISTGKAKDIELRLSTNLQVDLSRKLVLHSHFKNINISISIDGTHETYEYIRWPGKWNKLKNNIKILKDANGTDYQPSITLVLQNLNVDNVYDFFIEMQDVSDKINITPVWGDNKIEIIPTQILEEQLEKLNSINHSASFFVKNLLKSSIILSKNLDPLQVASFFNKQKMHDIQQNQNLFTAKPHFIELAEQFNYEMW
jgi:sulfatase maturation enzyme AslB (radical SAM superfamily)